MTTRTLARIRVLDLTRIYDGPYCSMLFADTGAEVIKIEPPEGEIIRGNPPLVKEGEGEPHNRSRSGYFLTLNRKKYGITLNFKHPKAPGIFKDLDYMAACFPLRSAESFPFLAPLTVSGTRNILITSLAESPQNDCPVLSEDYLNCLTPREQQIALLILDQSPID